VPKFDNLSTIKLPNSIIESFGLYKLSYKLALPWEHTKWLLALKPHPLDKVYIWQVCTTSHKKFFE